MTTPITDAPTLLDVYAICQLYGVTSPPVFHAIKKLLRAGKGSGRKSPRQDVAEARDAPGFWK